MKVIFLDIDGVLNHRPRMFGLDRKCVAILKRILDSTGAKIVVSSSWKYFPDEPMVSSNWRLTLAGMLGRGPEVFIGDTPDVCILDSDKGIFIRKRGDEIKSWLEMNPVSDITYCVIDDEISDIRGMVADELIFKTNSKVGMTDAIANRIIGFLNKRKEITENGIR